MAGLITVRVTDRVRGGWGNRRELHLTEDAVSALLARAAELRALGEAIMAKDPKKRDSGAQFLATPIGETVILNYYGTASQIARIRRGAGLD